MQPVMEPVEAACKHSRTVIIARRDGVDYVECLDCRLISEAEDLEPAAPDDEEEE
jgi:Zn ribbon nucleic-acid-binding protein